MAKKFLLFGQARSGTWLCVEGLRNHPEILCGGELYHFYSEIRQSMYADTVGYSPEGRELYAMNGDLNRYFFTPAKEARPDCSAVGFKLLYEHAAVDWARADLALQNDSDIAVIHLIRENPFHSMVSWWIACLSGAWKNQKTVRSVSIDPKAAKIWLERRENWQRFVKTLSTTNHVIEITYGELVNNYSDTVAALYEFLGVPPCVAVSPTLKRQDARPLSDKIENIDELRYAFSGTQWSTFLNDGVENLGNSGAFA